MEKGMRVINNVHYPRLRAGQKLFRCWKYVSEPDKTPRSKEKEIIMKAQTTVREHKAGEETFFKGLGRTLAPSLKKYRAVRFTLTALSALALCLLASAPLASAQSNVPVPAACKGIQNELNGLISERNGLQAELKMAAPGEKPMLAGQIKALIP